MLSDDLLRNMDGMLFHRTGPALMRGVRAQPYVAVGILQDCVGRLVEAPDAANFAGFSRAQSKNAQDYKALLGDD